MPDAGHEASELAPDATAATTRAPMPWFQRVWQSMTEEQQQRVRDKAKWEQRSLSAVLVDWPSLAPVGLRDLIPAPERDS